MYPAACDPQRRSNEICVAAAAEEEEEEGRGGIPSLSGQLLGIKTEGGGGGQTGGKTLPEKIESVQDRKKPEFRRSKTTQARVKK